MAVIPLRHRFRVLAAVALVLGVVPAATTAATGKSVVPFEAEQFTFVSSIGAPVATHGHLVQDHVSLVAVFAPLVQGGVGLDRVYDPATMRGTVTGTLGGNGPDTLVGTLRGVIGPEGMHGTFELTRTSGDWPGFYRIHGTWSSVGHPVAPSIGNLEPRYLIAFDGVEIGAFEQG